MSSRAAAWNAIKEWDIHGAHLAQGLAKAMSGAALSPADRRMCQELVFGTIRWLRWLDFVLDEYLDRKPGMPLRNLLRLGAYQLLMMNGSMPPHAAVHETVEAAREIGLNGLSGVTNAVLRKVADSISEWERRRAELEVSDPALALSHPAFLLDRWLSCMPPDEAMALMRANNHPSQVFLRVNTLHVAPEEAVARLTSEGVGVEIYPEHSLMIGLTRGFGMIEDLPGFIDGWYYVQDPSTLEPVDELAPLPGQRILDLCAAPGGKTTYMAQLMEDTGEIVAVDVDARRLDRLSANCKRLGVSNVRPVLWSPGLEDLRDLLGEQGYDGVLVDAPCSNTGVIRRRPEVRWRLHPGSWVELVQTQSSLLKTAAEQVRPGGRMVYSTCSVEREENEDRAADFLRHHVHWRKVNSKLVSGWQKGHDSGFYCCFNRD